MAYVDDGFYQEVVGMPANVADAMDVFDCLWPDDDGPGHIVYADYNLRTSDIEWCIGEINAGRPYSNGHEDTSHPIFAATRAVLEYLLTIPEEERNGWERYP